MKKNPNKIIRAARRRAKVSIFFLCLPAAILSAFALVLGAWAYSALAISATIVGIIPLIILATYCSKCLKRRILMDWGTVTKIRVAFLISLVLYSLVLLYFVYLIGAAFLAVWLVNLVIGVIPALLGMLLAFSAFAKARSL